MVTAPFVQSYPHLGGAGLDVGNPADPNRRTHYQVVMALAMWYAMIHNTPPFMHAGRVMFMDCPPYDQLDQIQLYRKGIQQNTARRNGKALDRFDYGKLALGRFWGDQNPTLMPPAAWEQGDIARYQLKDGRVMRSTGSAPPPCGGRCRAARC